MFILFIRHFDSCEKNIYFCIVVRFTKSDLCSLSIYIIGIDVYNMVFVFKRFFDEKGDDNHFNGIVLLTTSSQSVIFMIICRHENMILFSKRSTKGILKKIVEQTYDFARQKH